VQQVTPSHNLTETGFNDREIIADNLAAEVIYAGGGNFLALFREQVNAEKFLSELSRKVLFEAPGLQLVGHLKEFVWDETSEDQDQSLSRAVTRILNELKDQRNEQPLTVGTLGLGVTVMCDSTSLPAVGLFTDQDNVLRVYSAESRSKQVYAAYANEWLRDIFALDQRFRYPLDFDDLGRSKGEKSYLAVVHADGNGLGVLIRLVGEKHSTPAQNRDYINALRDFSQKVKRATKNAIQKTLAQLQQNLKISADGKEAIIWDEQHAKKLLVLTPRSEAPDKGDFDFPFRPLVTGGDDVTFVCDGRIGLELAAIYLQNFEDATKELKDLLTQSAMGDRLYACAGIAIVKTHYPFARAYALADDLCQTAKFMLKERGIENASALDWHFTAGGLYGDVAALREREYTVAAGCLTLRPVFLKEDAHEYASWEKILELTKKFQQDWRDSRNKAKELLEVLRQGPAATEAYQKRYLDPQSLKLPKFAGFESFAENGGWQHGICGYYDALELMDLLVPLKQATPEAAHG
jgi:hypothetical protein